MATVETRHAPYLDVLTDADPFPESFAPTRTKQAVLDATGGFVVDCEWTDYSDSRLPHTSFSSSSSTTIPSSTST
jgi:hypothetical protein